MPTTSTLRAFHVPTWGQPARFQQIRTLHYDLNDKFSLPAYGDWFCLEGHVDTYIIRLNARGSAHMFTIYYVYDADLYVPSPALLTKLGKAWCGELLVFRNCAVDPTLVNLRTGDDTLVWRAIDLFLQRWGDAHALQEPL
ncbi:hypothetical protein BV25DRAFT_1920184 [Artomyces pyxidatus]|uniref:Uncharacterized protein n=1 Tax=Artomyces pyxidatus TaxID=48021 RepID=A0ACB8SNF5_9AGAM|nr:hypothetical protein BV25DRAFT_1920184 [Artomyces pyxidatus]